MLLHLQLQIFILYSNTHHCWQLRKQNIFSIAKLKWRACEQTYFNCACLSRSNKQPRGFLNSCSLPQLHVHFHVIYLIYLMHDSSLSLLSLSLSFARAHTLTETSDIKWMAWWWWTEKRQIGPEREREGGTRELNWAKRGLITCNLVGSIPTLENSTCLLSAFALLSASRSSPVLLHQLITQRHLSRPISKGDNLLIIL